MDEVVVVPVVMVLFLVLDDHVAADGCDQRHDAVFHYFLHVLPRDESG